MCCNVLQYPLVSFVKASYHVLTTNEHNYYGQAQKTMAEVSESKKCTDQNPLNVLI